MKAEVIYNYYQIYREYLNENSLDDDSHKITVDNLVYFVENMIDEEYRLNLANRVLD